MTETQIAIAFAAFLVAGIVKGAVGIGQMTTAVALLGIGMDLRTAVPLLIAPALVSNFVQARRGVEAGTMFRRFALTNLLGGVGILVGTLILYRIDPRILATVLGVAVALYAAANLAKFDPAAPPRAEPALTPAVGLVSGVLTGATGSLHLLLAAWYAALRLPRDAYIQAIGVTFLVAGVFWAGALIWQGALTVTAALWSVGALVPTFIGMRAGTWARGRVAEATFRTALMVFLLALAVSLVWKSAV